MRIDAAAVLARRRRERDELLDRARQVRCQLVAGVTGAGCMRVRLGRAGGFNLWSDIDVLVVAETLPPGPLQRLEALADPLPLVRPVAWTPAEFAERLGKRDPIAVEALTYGVWLVGSAQVLAAGDAPT